MTVPAFTVHIELMGPIHNTNESMTFNKDSVWGP